MKYGSKDFFLALRKDAWEEIIEDIDNLLKLLVNEDWEENSSICSNMSSFTADEYSENGIVTEETKLNSIEKCQKFEDSLNDRDFGKFSRKIPQPMKRNSENHRPKNYNREFKPTEKIEEYKLNAFECLKNKRSGERTYIEIEKEHCELPYISLGESDENQIMDWGVKIRYGDSKSVSEVSRELESHLLKDYPLEVFLQRTEILNASLDIMVSTIDPSIFQNSVLLLTKFVENSVTLYKFLLNPYNRFWDLK